MRRFAFVFVLAGFCPTIAAQAAVNESAVRDCEKKQSSHWANVSPDVMNLCHDLLRSGEAKPLKAKACGPKLCIYRLKVVGTANINADDVSFKGEGMTLRIKRSDKHGVTVDTATLIDAQSRTTIFKNSCEEGPCDPFQYISGPDPKAELEPGDANSWVVRLAK